MNQEPVIEVRNLSKAYPIYENPREMLAEAIWKKSRHNNFWALKDINFSVQNKSRVGIIGPNGSGKSTLLQVITGNLKPTEGSVTVNGEISGMLSLNSVLNAEETGLNNIRFNLILNGCDKKDVPRLTEDIVEFTELGQFIYSPVRTYSSGMNARLAFGIATAIEPEILVVDEVLSVGDAYFVGKATQRMIELCDRGKALLFVSHAVADVQRLCDTVIWLENGVIRKMGPSEYVVKQYEEDYRRREDEAIRQKNKAASSRIHRDTLPDVAEGKKRAHFRIVPTTGAAISGTYYVRELSYGNEHDPALVDVISNDDDENGQVLDLFGSQWGRVFEWREWPCRLLEAKTGRSYGGHFNLPITDTDASSTRYEIDLLYRGRATEEPLCIEYFDYEQASWCQPDTQDTVAQDDNWQRLRSIVSYPLVDEQVKAQTRVKIAERARPSVEIVDVDLLQSGNSVRVIGEREPFQVAVTIKIHRPIEDCDVCIKITRTDGLHAFWQSAGLVGANVNTAQSSAVIHFEFNDNFFAAGDYLLGSVATNGWDYPDNYPYSEVYDRKVSVLQFTVRREMAAIDFGSINQRVPVRIDYETT